MLDPALALLRRKTKEEWTDKHRNVARNLVLEGGSVQKRLFDIGWSNESKCREVTKRKAQKNTGSTIVHVGMKSDAGSQRLSEVGAESQNFREGIEVAKRCCAHPLSESRWNRAHFQHEKVGV